MIITATSVIKVWTRPSWTSATTGVPDAGISWNTLPTVGRRVTAAAAAGTPSSHHVSQLHHHSSSNTVESPINAVKSPVLAEFAHDLLLQPVYEI